MLGCCGTRHSAMCPHSIWVLRKSKVMREPLTRG
jgi:hypothetical protein